MNGLTVDPTLEFTEYKEMFYLRASFALIALFSSVISCAPKDQNNSYSVVDQKADSGFSVYRSGQPETPAIAEWCKAGVKSIYALNGRGSEYAEQLAKDCPQAKIIFDLAQDADVAVDHAFLEDFDREITSAQAGGYGVMFHCNCGCHRTGRLAAYYRMKYNQWTADQAIAEMNSIGKDMDEHVNLIPQVRAMDDYIHARPCSQEARYCVK